MDAVCLACGKPTKIYRSSGRAKRFCNHACQQQYSRYGGYRLLEDATCPQCGTSFVRTALGRTRKYCSRRCAQAYQQTHRNGETCVCKWCARVFIPKARDRVTFCGRACYDEWRRSQDKHGRKSRCPKTCITCGVVIQRARKRCVTCSRAHELSRGIEKYYANKVYEARDVLCCECGIVFHVERRARRRRYCSHACSRKAEKRRNKGQHRKRARKYGVAYDSTVKLAALMLRDNGRCMMCGHKVKLTKKHSRRRATLGHIVAMSKGGSHTWDNVQLECWACNTKWNDVAHGNKRLFA